MKPSFFFLLVLFATSSSAQTMMMNYNKVHYKDQTKAYTLFETYFVPEFDKMVDQGKISNFGLLGHGWGDEWNMNYFITAKTQQELMHTFSEVFKATRQSMGAEKWNEFMALIVEHKDNLYDVRHYHDGH